LLNLKVMLDFERKGRKWRFLGKNENLAANLIA
jgi:hypothetical protein